jgi:hypothetical protein
MSPVPRRLPEVRSLSEILPKGAEGGKEFARIVDLLLVHDSRKSNTRTTLFSDVAGDFRGLDSFSGDSFRKEGTTGYQYKFYSSPLSADHRKEIEAALLKAAHNQKELKLTKWVLVTPQDFIESATRADGGDVTWFEGLRAKHDLTFELEHWGHKRLVALFIDAPLICLFYYPELVDEGQTRKRTINETRQRYDRAFSTLHRDIQFIGMSVYKPEATRGVAIQDIYIPLTILPESADPSDTSYPRENPLHLLEPGSRHVVLGDPGSGKSTLVRFLGLAGQSKALQQKYGAKVDGRLPVVVTLRKYADELKSEPNLSLFEYMLKSIQADFSLRDADSVFLEYFFESGQAILFLDGLDELPSPHFKLSVKDRIKTFVLGYPGNTAIVTSRIVGYEEPLRFDSQEYRHHRIGPLRLREIEQFVRDWYRVRLDNKVERDRNVNDLVRLVRDEEHTAIRQLSENPLLLTIVALVHRIDAVLPDERVILYQKCTETLLNTWHIWKDRQTEQKNKGKIERRNRARLEAIAFWMQRLSIGNTKKSRAVVAYNDLHAFLTEYITNTERYSDPDSDAQDSAKEFLDFVKRRAGLLVEAGDGQYSFVHLTFQEYLTATCIKRTNEAKGAEGIWDTMSPHCCDPRWHEVLRLLLGSLDSQDSQAMLLDRLLERANCTPDSNLAELLGGLVLDGIEPAEDKKREIFEIIIAAAAKSTSLESCRRLVRIVKNWQAKDSFDQGILESIFLRSVSGSQKDMGEIVIAPALGVSPNVLMRTRRSTRTQTLEYFLDLFFGSAPLGEPSEEIADLLRRLIDAQKLCLASSRPSNRAAARLLSVAYRTGPSLGCKWLFEALLASFVGGPFGGPFFEFTANMLEFEGIAIGPELDSSGHRDRSMGKDSPSARLRDALLSLTNLTESENVSHGNQLWESGRSALEAYVKTRGLKTKIKALRNEAPPTFRKSLSASRVLPVELSDFDLDVLCRTLNLRPETQWKCALGVRFLQIEANAWPFSEDSLQSVEERFRRKSQSEADCYFLAWKLLLDTWATIFHCDLPIVTLSPNHTVDSQTERADHPAVRVARGIRDVTLGRIDVDQFVAVSESADCRELLDRAGLQRVHSAKTIFSKKSRNIETAPPKGEHLH